MPRFALGHGGRYTVTGETVVTDELAGQITGAIGALLVVALVVMAIVLLLVFGRRRGAAGSVWLRLLPLAVALAAVGITFGLLAVVGARLTIAAVAVLPILVGLAVDYAVQFQARVAEAELSVPGQGRAAVAIAAARGGPTLATAALATAVAFLALELSPVPMVKGFGVLLVVGVAVALACALTAGAAVLAMSIGETSVAPAAGFAAASLGAVTRRLGARGRAAALARCAAGSVGPRRRTAARRRRRRAAGRACAERAVAGGGGLGAPAGAGAGDRAGPGGRGVGGLRPDPGAVRRHQARAAGQPGAP